MSSTQVYHGSCHCGHVKYQLRLTLPPALGPDHHLQKATRIYKCNCSTCHKMGMFHCRPIDTYDDFILISPSDPKELGVYNAFGGKVNWYFCKKCAVRTFGIGGIWAQEDLDVEKWAGGEGGDGKPAKVWRTKALEDVKGFDGKPLHYVSVNAITLEGVDLVDWHKKGWIAYYENRERKGTEPLQVRNEEPFPGGCF
ncbi:hypothetical protein K458DRAFT_316299 [Lentithecium fluviatile CBS 122367]|uniref:CENP-V/GFA domain-containing protein n=1 Tax=Lentithecium fluviatile CBS 122367 TaxID=1168545 RepID=A0A6G1IKK0_9PLEO|nr:hypothetical protein K458DRAFT_316299 [Lentithecium fluviatile CBS 122367]